MAKLRTELIGRQEREAPESLGDQVARLIKENEGREMPRGDVEEVTRFLKAHVVSG